MAEGDLFLRKTIEEKDWEKVLAPPGFSAIEGRHIVADNGLGLYVADGRNPDSDNSGRDVIVKYPQWSDGTEHNPMSQVRARVLAALAGKLVIYVDNPGVEIGNPRMSKEIKQALIQGDFKPGAIQQWDAVGEGLDLHGLGFDSISRLVGASLGTHVVAGATATAPGEVYLDEIDLLEVAGLNKKQSLARFALNFMIHGGDRWSELVQSNPGWAEEVKHGDPLVLAKLALQRPAGLIYPPIGIHRHNIDQTLVEAKNRKQPAIDGDTLISIAYGSESLISAREDNEHLARSLAREGFKTALLILEGGVHASQDNMGFWREYLEQINRLKAA